MNQLVVGFGGMVGGLALLFGAVQLAKCLAHHWHNSHPGLFCSLCRLHRLDRNSRRLLKQVVQYHRMSQPARVFIDPNWLDPARLGAAWRARSPEIAALRSRLFEADTASEA